MKTTCKVLTALVLTAALLLGGAVPALGAAPGYSAALEAAASYLHKSVPDPQVSSIGGEWSVVALARGGRLDLSQKTNYLQNLEDTLVEKQGVLSARKHTEYARAALALTALGADPRDAAGYDLLSPLEDFDATVRQGLNGAIFALIALDCGGDPVDPALRARYLNHILDAQLADGGWALYGAQADPDVTAQALQALAPYREDHQAAVSAGLDRLTALRSQGAFTTCESYAQALIALCALGEEVPGGFLTEFLAFQRSDGGFAHLPGGQTDQMASEQALCALTALERADRGQSALYDMRDAALDRGTSIRSQAVTAALWTAIWASTSVLRLGPAR